ncbi:hypothetical protein I3843_07G049300 [Carya illinoinensis]|uniref:Ubiquitin-conjugating enzyme E2C-binding protein n=1 Tax=Carya illinoinensis TaxID=32201 RepID=A0A922JD88_CARIL|nr:hypothetical protein I3842_07G052600 [Carya illinoinensis]KAG7969796.1 hypothetical protein I3843_07G049300 [Carya illinoinensis]
MSTQNPTKWRFTWEAQSHVPILRLFIFDSYTNPSTQCHNLKVHLNLSKSLVLVSFFEDLEVSLRVPAPRVLIDSETPVSFRALDDHIEVKLVLLLPVDHPIVTSFDSVFNLSQGNEISFYDASKQLEMDSDLKILRSGGGVHFYCRSCSFKLTKNHIRNFVEMPSVDWREVADNWFGTCCCSFGGVSEKLVSRYANAYTCVEGTCQLNSTTITISKNDLVEWKFPDWVGCHRNSSGPDFKHDDGVSEAILDSGKPNLSKDVASAPGCCGHIKSQALMNHMDEGCTHHVSETREISENQKCLLNGFLGNIFMVRSFNQSADIEWIEYVCPHCSSLLGAYPCGNGSGPIDLGVRLFKCYISTCLPVGGSGDSFRKYTLERMFTNQLLESAKDESSYRTVVRDVKTKSPLLQIVLLNPNSWCFTGYCLGADENTGSVLNINLQPVIKVLFSDCNNSSESKSRMIEDWETKNLADEVFMLTRQIKELIKSLVSRNDILPPSFSCLQGFSLSSMQR